MRIWLIDDLAWQVIRLVFFLQYLIFTYWYTIHPPEKLGDKTDAMGRVYGAWHIVETPRDELPEIVLAKLLPLGRFILAVFAISGIVRIVESLSA